MQRSGELDVDSRSTDVENQSGAARKTCGHGLPRLIATNPDEPGHGRAQDRQAAEYATLTSSRSRHGTCGWRVWRVDRAGLRVSR